MNYPDDLWYARSDEWLRVELDSAHAATHAVAHAAPEKTPGEVKKETPRTATIEGARQEAATGAVVSIGISDYKQHELGDVVYLELPLVGARLSSGVAFGVVESVKAVSDLLSPIEGEVIEVNEPVPNDPSLVNLSPYGDGWLLRVRLTQAPQGLMTASEYAQFRGASR